MLICQYNTTRIIFVLILTLTQLQIQIESHIQQQDFKKMQFQRCGDSHSSTQMHYINILDKCSQIMREDRIWLRTQIKNNSQQALNLFKGLSKMPNMKQLQIKLRKYVNNTKQKEKQQQLNRFKENMNSTHNIGIKQHFNAKQNSRESHQKNKTMQTNRHQNSSHSRSPLQQRNQNRQSKSLLSKWNNYAHYNYSSNHQNNQNESLNKVQTKKQWVNIYKPHTFNKMLNGQLNNKLLNNKNQSATHLKRDTKSIQPKNFMDINEKYQTEKQENYEKTFTSTLNPVHYGINRANNNSLKKFDFKPTKQITKQKATTVQPSKYKIAKEPQPKTFTKPFNQQNYSSKNEQTYMTSKLSKQNIDQILKYKLGYPYKYDGMNEQNNIDQVFEKKYDSGDFPPIEQQTERDSEYITSQRNHRGDQNKMFTIVNSNQYNHNKNWQMEHSTKQVNSNKGSNLNGTSYFNNFENTFRKENFSNMLSKNQQQYNHNSSQGEQDYSEEDSNNLINRRNAESPQQEMQSTQYQTFEKDEQKINRLFEQSRQCESSDRISNRNIQITEPVANRLSNIAGSNINQGFKNVQMIQSRQRSQTGDLGQSDLHKSILNSIRKSQEDFPSYSLQRQNYQKQERLSILKSSAINQYQSKFYSNPQQNKQFSISSSKNNELSQTTNQISSFFTSQAPLNFDTSSFSLTTNFSKLTPIQKSSINDDNIFTPPDLLNQCRMFLKKSKQLSEINCDFSVKPILQNQSTPERFGTINSISKNNNQPFNISKPYVPQKRLMIDDHAITVTQSITKDYYFSSQKNSQQKQCHSENGFSCQKPVVESKKVNFQMIGSVKPMENEYKQFSQHKLRTEQNNSYQNSLNKNNSNKKSKGLNQSVKEQKYFQDSQKKQVEQNISMLSNNKDSDSKNMINESQQSIKSKKVQQGDVVSYDGIHTFSNQSMSKSKQNSNRKTNRSAFNQVQLFDTKQSNKKKQVLNIKPITDLICLQDLVDQLLEASEGNLEVSTEWLLHTIQNHCYFQEQVTKSLQNVLSVFLNETQEQIQLMDVFNHLFKVYNSQKNFQFKDGNAKDIYLLLDIQKKGKITIEDIHSFSQSLQEAEIQNFQIISQKLQEMFQLANLSQTNVLTYLNLYIIKNQPVFEQVCQLLQDFQFQIQSE